MTKGRKFIMTSFLIGLGIVLLAGCQSKATNEPTTGTKKAETMQTTEEKIKPRLHLRCFSMAMVEPSTPLKE